MSSRFGRIFMHAQEDHHNINHIILTNRKCSNDITVRKKIERNFDAFGNDSKKTFRINQS